MGSPVYIDALFWFNVWNRGKGILKFGKHVFFSHVGRLVLIRKPGSLQGYLFSWLYPYHYGASFSIWFTTLSRSCRNQSSGKDKNQSVIYKHSGRNYWVVFFFPLYLLLGYYGWFQFTALTAWVVHLLIKATLNHTHHHRNNHIFALFTVDCIKIPQYSHLCGHM